MYPASKRTKAPRPEPDLQVIDEAMKQKHTNLSLLWYEYKLQHPDGIQYTQFCERYRRYRKKKHITMHQHHKPGEIMFVDWCGDPMYVQDSETGQSHPVYLFVSTVGVSGYPYVEAFSSKHLQNWIYAHIHAFDYYQKVPLIVVPDNDKSAVTKVHPYEPQVQKHIKN